MLEAFFLGMRIKKPEKLDDSLLEIYFNKPWTLSREEYAWLSGYRVSGQSAAKTRRLAWLLHRDHVKIWLSEGIPVSKKALKYYPELRGD